MSESGSADETADETAPEEQPQEPHRDDGLDLARSLTRATAGSTAAQPLRRRRRPTGADSPQARKDPTGDGGSSRSPAASRRGRLSGSHPDDRDPQLLGGELSRLVDDRGWELSLRMRGVFARWAELVGDEVADHCTPESFTDGKLVVRADSTAWTTQLRLLAPRVVGRLNEDLGPGTVVAIDVVGPHLPTWSKGRRTTRDGRGPRDTYG